MFETGTDAPYKGECARFTAPRMKNQPWFGTVLDIITSNMVRQVPVCVNGPKRGPYQADELMTLAICVRVVRQKRRHFGLSPGAGLGSTMKHSVYVLYVIAHGQREFKSVADKLNSDSSNSLIVSKCTARNTLAVELNKYTRLKPLIAVSQEETVEFARMGTFDSIDNSDLLDVNPLAHRKTRRDKVRDMDNHISKLNDTQTELIHSIPGSTHARSFGVCQMLRRYWHNGVSGRDELRRFLREYASLRAPHGDFFDITMNCANECGIADDPEWTAFVRTVDGSTVTRQPRNEVWRGGASHSANYGATLTRTRVYSDPFESSVPSVGRACDSTMSMDTLMGVGGSGSGSASSSVSGGESHHLPFFSLSSDVPIVASNVIPPVSRASLMRSGTVVASGTVEPSVVSSVDIVVPSTAPVVVVVPSIAVPLTVTHTALSDASVVSRSSCSGVSTGFDVSTGLNVSASSSDASKTVTRKSARLHDRREIDEARILREAERSLVLPSQEECLHISPSMSVSVSPHSTVLLNRAQLSRLVSESRIRMSASPVPFTPLLRGKSMRLDGSCVDTLMQVCDSQLPNNKFDYRWPLQRSTRSVEQGRYPKTVTTRSVTTTTTVQSDRTSVLFTCTRDTHSYTVGPFIEDYNRFRDRAFVHDSFSKELAFGQLKRNSETGVYRKLKKRAINASRSSDDQSMSGISSTPSRKRRKTSSSDADI